MMTLKDTIGFLQELISIPAFSREEGKAAGLVAAHLASADITYERHGNNVWACNPDFNTALPTVLLNSHIDTVQPAGGWNSDPFKPLLIDSKLTGLGANDAGASLACLLASFINHCKQSHTYNLVFAASAEEEISGSGGMESLVAQLPQIDFAIVGEPTGMRIAVAEKGLMVLDCTAFGQAGHAARDEGVNAIDIALQDILWMRENNPGPDSPVLGPVKLTTTVIAAGSHHNVVPESCTFTVDARTTDTCGNLEVLEHLSQGLRSVVQPRSTRLNASGVPESHAIIEIAGKLNLDTYGSPTLSDQALMPWPSVKIGPGDSARSHTANEYVLTSEIDGALGIYQQILNALSNATLG